MLTPYCSIEIPSFHEIILRSQHSIVLLSYDNFLKSFHFHLLEITKLILHSCKSCPILVILGDTYDLAIVQTKMVDSNVKGTSQCHDAFVSSIDPLLKKFEQNLHQESVYVEKLHNLCFLLQEENKCLRNEINDLKEFIIITNINQSTTQKAELSMLQNKIRTLEVALRVELLKTKECQKELDDARHVLVRRTRAKVRHGQMFEVVIAQKPQEVTMALCATSLDRNAASCPICLEEFDVASGWYTLNCGHRYHLVCLAKVMPTRARCCVCNKDLHKLLYEIFGLANVYPSDARLWDAQTGHPVDFTVEEDIRVVVAELEDLVGIREIIDDGEEEELQEHNFEGDNGDESEDNSISVDDHNEDEEEEDLVAVETDIESDDESSSNEGDHDDPCDPDYDPHC